MKHYLSAVLGFAIWGTFALVLKPLSAYAALDILIHRVIFAAISIAFVCFMFRRKQTFASIHYVKTISPKERVKLLINMFFSAIMLGLNWFSFIYVMNAVSVNATSLAYLICPILTTVLASLFLREKLNIGQWFAVLLSLISCLILAYGHFMDLIYSMVIALSYAIYLVLQKNTFQMDKFFTLTIHIVVSTFLLLPILTVIDTTVPKTMTFYGLVAIIAVGYTIIPLFLNIFALKGLDSSIVGTLLYLNPIISFLLAILYYKEPINTVQLIAFGMIFTAVVIFNIAYLYGRKRNMALK
ncbi:MULTISPECIES: EamA family transporter [Olivibacter]|jgi:chloramphenicol-sensitive protein RarD|uniref:RarD protein, DMT superfamily transporter n=2 Tax=Sphingobacteriaceae TaxID=84566 RepID=F4C4J0_SPHS2|nr:EamA family transporter [Olivibacter jilunii]MCL4640008.1 EamA family transporter [Olivibacter sp. UJ_SKK_5.1]